MGLLRGWQRSFAVLPLLVLGLAADAGCYSTGDGTAPPLNSFYFPVGLAVSHGGNVLYAVNSDFDLQYNGGTLQSYDLRLIRQHTLLAIKDPTDKALPLVRGATPGCSGNPPLFRQGEDGRQPLGETCAPPVRSEVYFRDSAVIGAFATDLLLTQPASALQGDYQNGPTKAHADDALVPATDYVLDGRPTDRLFAPVRGNSTLTWAEVARDDLQSLPSDTDTRDSYRPFKIRCGQDGSNRCDAPHQVGSDANEPGNTRHLTMPGEPFGVTISDDGASLLVTHQDDTKTTLFSTGLSRRGLDADAPLPAIRFVADNVPLGGVGISAVPHDADAFLGASELPLPAFLETSRSVAQVSLIRRYRDDGASAPPPALKRPFLNVETAFPITASAGGTDSRGIAIDPTPRLACKARVPAVGPNMTVEERDKQIQACARKPARVFIANRSPASLLVGEVGTTQGIDANYDPDRLTIHTSVPLADGPSRVYLAPVVDRDGAYALRVFVVCFDSASIYVYDPDAAALENVIRVGPGPFAMAFDPFSLNDVATHAKVPTDDALKDPAQNDAPTRRYRFAYLASFTQSFVQILDLDDAVPNPATFERIVYTLGRPTNPKGT